MNWNNLKTYQCPKCGSFLSKSDRYYCKFDRFTISFGKLINLIGRVDSLEKQASNLIKKKQ